MTGYAWVQMNARGMVLDHCEFSSSGGPAVVFNDGMKYLTVNHCTFYSAAGRAVELGTVDAASPADSVRFTNNIFYSKVANYTEGTVAFPGTSGFTSHHNVFFTPSFTSQPGDRAVNWSGRSGSVGAWCAASGKDCNSAGGDPRFLNLLALGSLDLRLGAGSAAIGVAEAGQDAGAYPFGPDAVPPAPILDLAVTYASDHVAVLGWTAPGDNGASGTAAAYDIRWATVPITEDSFDSAARFATVPDPLPAGSPQSYVAMDLNAGQTYFFAIKTRDQANNWSPVSNPASITTEVFDRKAPDQIQDLQASP
jgi:hypothetical protein